MEQRGNNKLAPAWLQQASLERLIRLARDAAMTEEELESTCLRRVGVESQRILDIDAALNEARLN